MPTASSSFLPPHYSLADISGRLIETFNKENNELEALKTVFRLNLSLGAEQIQSETN